MRNVFDKPNNVSKAVCAVSGGMDSTVCLFKAVKDYGKENVLAVSIFYGQKHDVELQRAQQICKKLDVKLLTFDLKSIFSVNKNISALLADSNKEI